MVHKDYFEWKLNYINDIKSCIDDSNSKGIFFTRFVINENDIRIFNEKNHVIKKIFQKEPIIMDVYI